MRAMVVGAGSIGLRHQRVLSGLGLEVALVSRRTPQGTVGGDVLIYAELPPALVAHAPDHVVVATETTDHLRVLTELAAAGFAGSVIVEKPVVPATTTIPSLPFRICAVGYQLRLHPAVLAARELLVGQRVLAVHAHVGQHLAAWRPGRGVGESASARLDAGGGALRDLSHELDLVLWLAGGWRRVCAVGGRSGALGPDVETDDRWAILLELEDGAIVTIHLDMLDHVGQRRMTVVTAERTLALDLVAGTLQSGDGRSASDGADAGGGSDLRTWTVDRDGVLAELHRTVLAARTELVCSIPEGLAVVELIAAVELSAAESRWVARTERIEVVA